MGVATVQSNFAKTPMTPQYLMGCTRKHAGSFQLDRRNSKLMHSPLNKSRVNRKHFAGVANLCGRKLLKKFAELRNKLPNSENTCDRTNPSIFNLPHAYQRILVFPLLGSYHITEADKNLFVRIGNNSLLGPRRLYVLYQNPAFKPTRIFVIRFGHDISALVIETPDPTPSVLIRGQARRVCNRIQIDGQ